MKVFLPGTVVPEHQCLRCGYICDAAGGVGSDPQLYPTSGSVSLCIACGNVAIFRSDGSLREPTVEEMREVDADPETTKIRSLLAKAIRERSS